MNLLYKIFATFFLLLGMSSLAWSKTLSPDEAFKPQITYADSQRIDFEIMMPQGYYLYRSIRFNVSSSTLNITNIQQSEGSTKEDDFFGTQSIWNGGEDKAKVSVHFDNPDDIKTGEILIEYQGCEDGVICYPPQKKKLTTDLISKADSPSQESAPKKQSQSFLTKKPDNKLFSALSNKSSDTELLREEEAFPFSLTPLDATTLALRFSIADGYYIYRDKIKLTIDGQTADKSENLTSTIKFVQGDTHHDEFYGEQVIYRGENTVAQIYLSQPIKDLSVKLEFQGCAEGRICYPVMNRSLKITNGKVTDIETTEASKGEPSTLDKLINTLTNNLWAGVGLLLIAGIALSFTPCVLPMLPILLGIITNQRKVSKPRAFALSFSYALGVATMMAVFGLVVAKTGLNIQIIFQQPLWLILFASVFILMGLSMLGVFAIAMPGGIQAKIINLQNRFQDTNMISMFIVGALSTLVIGPCIAPPLIAILAFISTTGDSLVGALYLFSLGLGMSLPLVIFASLVTTIPKTGALSRLVTRLFAMLMFGVGLWLLNRLLPGSLSLILWGIFAAALALLFARSGFIKPYAKTIATALAVICTALSMAWITGGIMGNSNPLKPFTKVTKLPFQLVHNEESLNMALQSSDKPVMLDLYADWCVSCQEVEHFTLTNPDVVEKLQSYTLLKLDISESTAANRELLKKYDLIGPPTMMFFTNGTEINELRHVGAIKADALIKTLNQVQPTN